MLADTKTVRKIVFNTVGLRLEWCRKSADENVRLLAGYIDKDAEVTVQAVQKALSDLGYNNKVYYTTSGWCSYLHIRAAFI